MQGKTRILALAGAGLVLFCHAAGCSHATETEEKVVILEQEGEETGYTIAAVTVGDVQETVQIDCVYKQTGEQDISFGLDGRKIAKVYVEEGDAVEKGQLLAELSLDDIDAEIAEVQYQIARIGIQNQKAQDDRDFSIKSWILANEGVEMTDEERQDYFDRIEDMKQDCVYQMEDYEDALTVQNQKLQKLLEEKNGQCVYAGISGKISYRKENLEGSISVSGEKILSIIDDSECLFYSDETEYKDLFSEGQCLRMSIVGSFTECQVVPDHMDTWDETMEFAIVEDENTDRNLKVGTQGKMEIVQEEHDQVLTLPRYAVHSADGKSYVYVLGENDIREVKWISTGLAGNDVIEITEGLDEGDKVILK